MPLPLLLLGAAGAALIGHCGREVNDDWARELNSLNDKMQKLCDSTNQLIETSQSRFDNAYNKLYDQKVYLYDTTLTEFSNVMSCLKKVDFEKDIEKKEIVASFRENMATYKDNSSHRGKTWAKPSTTIARAMMFGLVGQGVFFVGSMVKGVQLGFKIDEAKAEHAKLSAECENTRLKCIKVESMTVLCINIYQTIDMLNKLAKKVIKEACETIKKSGEDYSAYSEDDKKIVMTMYNLSLSLNDLVCTDIFDDVGEVLPVFQKFINKAEEFIEVE